MSLYAARQTRPSCAGFRVLSRLAQSRRPAATKAIPEGRLWGQIWKILVEKMAYYGYLVVASPSGQMLAKCRQMVAAGKC